MSSCTKDRLAILYIMPFFTFRFSHKGISIGTHNDFIDIFSKKFQLNFFLVVIYIVSPFCKEIRCLTSLDSLMGRNSLKYHLLAFTSQISYIFHYSGFFERIIWKNFFKISEVLSRFDFKVTFRLVYKIKFSSPKDPIPIENRSGIYFIPCSFCNLD